MKIKAVDFVTYIVSDLNKSIEWYKDILGLKFDSSGDSWAEFDAGNLAIVLGTWGYDPNMKNGNGVALAVDDVKKALTELKKKGVKVDDEVWETPVCFGGAIEDLDGNKIILHQRKDQTFG